MGVTELLMNMPSLTSALAIDCEMVEGRRMKMKKQRVRDVPSRFYIVNDGGKCVYDTYINSEYEVECEEETRILMASGKQLSKVKGDVKKIIKKRILIGHDVKTALKLIGLTHSKNMINNAPGFSLTEKVGSTMGVTNHLSVYCETVRVQSTAVAVRWSELRDLAGRVSLVNENGDCVYDSYINHDAIFQITDYRTSVSGLTAALMAGGKPTTTVKKDVAELIRKLIVVGHDVAKDLKVLGLAHPEWNKMDTVEYKGFMALVNDGKPSLKLLAKEILNIDIQQGAHSSVEDAKTAMKLYHTVGDKWEEDKCTTRQRNKRKQKKIATVRLANQSE